MPGPQQYDGCPLMGNDAAWRAGHARPLQGGAGSVSYTHLDVYKRQILYYLLLKNASVVENFYFSLLRVKIFNNSGI